MLVAGCGYGKGVITTKIIEGAAAKGKNVLFLVRGRDRVADMHKRVAKLGIAHGVLMGGTKRERWHSVQVSSSDTVHRMKEKPKADLIIIDECHLSLSPSFRGVLDCYPGAKILGLTATPLLGTGHPLGKKSGGIFESMVKGPSVRQLISEGYLVRSEVIAPTPPADLKNLRKMATGEFDAGQGEAICDTPKIIGDAVEHYRRFASGLKAVSFGFTQKHASDIAESFRAAGINWAYVDANTPDDEREHIWRDYDTGDLVGISSCGVISIGWDHSICKCLILCGKTNSFPLYHQRLGRGSRPHPGHDHFRVHDHTGNWLEFVDQGPFFESDIDWQLDGAPRKTGKPISVCETEFIGDRVPGFTGVYADGVMFPCNKPFERKPNQEFCPNCGMPLTKEKREGRAEIEEEDGALVTVTAKLRAEIESRIREQSEQKGFYLDLLKRCVARGYKRGWALHKYRDRYGSLPPRAWNRELEFAAGLRESMR